MNDDVSSLNRRLDRLEATTRLADRWLTATAIFLTLFGFVALLIGVNWITELRENVQQSRVLLDESHHIIAQMETNKDKTKVLLSQLEEEKREQGSQTQPEELFASLSNVLAQFGAEPSVHSGTLLNQESRSEIVTLSPLKEYTIAGFCDLNCSDLDLEVFDPDHNAIAEDTLPDDAPLLTIVPLTRGEHRIRVSMYACSNASGCQWKLNVYEQGSTTPVRSE